MKKNSGKGTFKNLLTGESYDLRWAGHWGVNGKNMGVLISTQDLTHMHIQRDELYSVKFHFEEEGRTPHTINSVVMLDGIDSIHQPGKKTRIMWVLLKNVENLEAVRRLDELKEQRGLR